MIYDVKSHLQSDVLGLIPSWNTDVLYHTQLRTRNEHGEKEMPRVPASTGFNFLVKTICSITELLPHSFMIRPSNTARQYVKRSPSMMILTRGSTSYNLYSGYSTKINEATLASKRK